MTTEDSESNAAESGSSLPDAHGRAALLLVESLIHGLHEKSVIRIGEAIDIVERAISVQADEAEAAGGSGLAGWQSHSLLLSIAASLRVDSEDKPAPPQPAA